MGAGRTSETSVNFHQITRASKSEDSRLKIGTLYDNTCMNRLGRTYCK
jgi:hypothetical protein